MKWRLLIRFSLQEILVITLVIAIISAWVSNQMYEIRRQAVAVREILRLGGRIKYSYGGNRIGPSVSYVDLSGRSVRDGDLVWLNGLRKCHPIVLVIDLSNTLVTDKGVSALEASLARESVQATVVWEKKADAGHEAGTGKLPCGNDEL
jgi:hypothetical protein